MELDVIKCMDCLDYLRGLPDESVNLVVTSPPYNKEFYNKHRAPTKWDAFRTKVRAIDYGEYDDRRLPHEYTKWQKEILSECIRVLKPDGSIFYNHKDILCEKRSIPPLYVWDFNVREVLVWNRSCTPTIDRSYFYPIHEYVYWITKTNKGRVKFQRNNIPLEYRKSIISVTRELNNNHPAPFPPILPEIFIRACTDVGDVVLDPFMGSGTTALSARNLGRHYIGSELNPKFVEMANRRLGVELFDYSLFLGLCLRI